MAKHDPIKSVLLSLKVAVLLSSLFLCGSCTTSQRETPPVLIQVEALLQSHPDSAYALLLPIDPSTLDSIDWAHYYYLYTAAANKLGQHISWHKEMQRAADIYAPILEEEDSKARVYYYAALALRENEEDITAMEYYYKSLKFQSDEDYTRLSCFTYMGMFRCCYRQSLFNEAIIYIDKMIIACNHIKNIPYLRWALQQGAHTYICLEMYDMAYDFLSKYQLVSRKNGLKFDPQYHNTMSTLLLEIHSYEQAKMHCDSVGLSLTSDMSIADYYINKANIFYCLGNVDSAKYYYKTSLQEVTSSEFKRDVYMELFSIANVEKDSLSVNQYKDSLRIYTDLTSKSKYSDAIRRLILQNENSSILWKDQWTFLLIAAFSLILILLGIYRKRVKQQNKEIINKIIIAEKENKTLQEKFQLAKISNEQQFSIKQFCDNILEPNVAQFKQTNHYEILKTMLHSNRILAQDKQFEIKNAVYIAFSQTLKKLEEHYDGNISMDDWFYLIMTYMKFPLRTIARCYTIEKDSIRQRKGRIRKKMDIEYFKIFFKQ